MKISILGSTGMLGNAMGKYFIEKYGEDNIFLSYREEQVSYGKNKFHYDANGHTLDNIPRCDYIINCIGTIKPFMSDNMTKSIWLNSIFPIFLSNYAKLIGVKVIHITTDCVFSGRDGLYTEKSLHDALDDYGKSKSLGEYCQNESMVIRTSIIGEEIHKKASLIEWVKSQRGKEVNGYINHLWNGVTTKQYAKICSQIINNDLYEEGLFHVFSNIVSKYDLLHMIDKKFKLNLIISKFETDKKCDRSLSTIKKLNSKLDIPLIEEQIIEL